MLTAVAWRAVIVTTEPFLALPENRLIIGLLHPSILTLAMPVTIPIQHLPVPSYRRRQCPPILREPVRIVATVIAAAGSHNSITMARMPGMIFLIPCLPHMAQAARIVTILRGFAQAIEVQRIAIARMEEDVIDIV